MAEGDSIARLAARLDRQLAGSRIARSDVRHPRFAGADLAGQSVTGWRSRGKHLLLRTDAGWTVHSHLRMSGGGRCCDRASGCGRWPRICGSRSTWPTGAPWPESRYRC